MLMTSCFVCANLNLGRKKSTGTEPKVILDFVVNGGISVSQSYLINPFLLTNVSVVALLEQPLTCNSEWCI